MKKGFLTLSFLVCFAAFMYGQSEYKSAIGLRFGYPVSISYKTFISDPGAIEAFVGFRGWEGYNTVSLGAMYEHHMQFPDVAGLKWYFGGGAGMAFYNYDDNFSSNDDYSDISFGIILCLGLDYKFANAPVNLSLDWTPTIRIAGGYGDNFGAGYGALSARYTFK
jgi:hypothetical protein